MAASGRLTPSSMLMVPPIPTLDTLRKEAESDAADGGDAAGADGGRSGTGSGLGMDDLSMLFNMSPLIAILRRLDSEMKRIDRRATAAERDLYVSQSQSVPTPQPVPCAVPTIFDIICILFDTKHKQSQTVSSRERE